MLDIHTGERKMFLNQIMDIYKSYHNYQKKKKIDKYW